MVQNNALNQFSSLFSVGTTSIASTAEPLKAQINQNAETAIAVTNTTDGANSRAIFVAASSAGVAASIGAYSASYAGVASFAGKAVINTDTSLLINYATASDSVVIARGGTSFPWTMSGNMERTMPYQPCFLAYNSLTDDNVTGDGTVFTCDFDTEVFDQGANFAADTFTAPVTGRYKFDVGIDISSIGAGHTFLYVKLVTSNRTADIWFTLTNPIASTGTILIGNGITMDMDLDDTAVVTIQVSGGAKTVGFGGADHPLSYFSGFLVC